MGLLQRKILTIGLVALLVWSGQKAWQVHGQRQAALIQVRDLESRAAELEKDNQFLASSSAYFASDAYLERQARLKLNYKLADEQVAFVYKDAASKSLEAKVGSTIDLTTLPNWKKWRYYLTGY